MNIKRFKYLNDFIAKNDFILSSVFMGIFVIALFITDIGCPTRYLSGICCPGCGMTRAILQLLKFDFKGAFYYHPMVYALPIIVFLFIKRNDINKKLLNTSLAIIILLFLLVYVIRLFDVNNDVVYADIRRSIIYKILGTFKK